MSQENNFVPEQDTYKPLSPFKLFVKSNFPFIEATFEALDNYGLYCKIVEYLNNVIENENTVESNVGALYDAFVSLNNYVSNYFENLDVQEEINNKLDQMVTNGELQTLINNRFDNLENQIEAVASGSPAGVFATYNDLVNTDPNHNKIYLVTSNGGWYFYDTSSNQWTLGGIYQASLPSENLEEISSKLNEVTEATTDYIVSNNKFDANSDETLLGHSLTGDGTVTENASYLVSNFIPVEYGDELTFSVGDQVLATPNWVWFYASDKETTISNDRYHSTVTAPQYAKYMRFSIAVIEPISQKLMVSSGDEAKPYEAYFDSYYILKNQDEVDELKLAMSSLSTKTFEYVAHQGYSKNSPYAHSKIGSYKEAKENGFTIGETDLVYSSDGVPMCCHDTSFIDETTHETIVIGEHTAEELQTYDYYGGTIGTLDDIIKECKENSLKLILDHLYAIPNDTAWAGVRNIIKKYQMQDDIILLATADWMCDSQCRWYNKSTVFFSGASNNYLQNAITFANLYPDATIGVTLNYSSFTIQDLITYLYNLPANIQLHLYTIDNKQTFKQYMPYCRSITTNDVTPFNINS